jgi:hypothetical protein
VSFALWFSRDRKSTSDFDRNRRQQQVLRAILRSARAQGLIQKAPELWGQVTQIVTTNLQLTDVLGLVPLALDLEPGRISSYTMIKGYQTEHFKTPQGEDVQVPSPAGFFETIRNFYTPPSTNRLGGEATKIVIENASGGENWDRLVAEVLSSKGLPAESKGVISTVPMTQVIDFTGGASPNTLALIKKSLNLTDAQIISQPDPNRTVDMQITVGADLNACTAPGFKR